MSGTTQQVPTWLYYYFLPFFLINFLANTDRYFEDISPYINFIVFVTKKFEIKIVKIKINMTKMENLKRQRCFPHFTL